MTECSYNSRVEHWARQGALAELPDELVTHVGSCAMCSVFVSQVRELRETVAHSGKIDLSKKRVDEMRFLLMAEARRAPLPMLMSKRVSSIKQPWHWSLALAAAVLLALVAAGWSFGSRKADAPLQQHLAQVILAPGAAGHPVSTGPHGVYALFAGTASFDVRALGEGETYRVLVGRDSVAVRGTRFRVEARERKLRAVQVDEGRVVVRLGGKEARELVAGDEWQRPEAADPVRERPRTSLPREENVVAPETANPALTKPGRSPAPSGGARDVAHDLPTTNSLPSDPRASAAHERHDAAFQRAWRLLRSGSAREAAAAFDRLARDPEIDAGRRSDALYWSAKAHEQAGEVGVAEQRANSLNERDPSAWHAPHAALLMAEQLAKSDPKSARRWAERALHSSQPEVRTRAEALIDELSAQE